MQDHKVKEFALGLLKQESSRDKQKKIGASQISDPCTYHLAKALLAESETPSRYWLGAKIGTGVHLLLEDAVAKTDMPEAKDALVEQKIVLGTLDGYGEITSKPDLMLTEMNHLIDWKTTTRKKAKKLQASIDFPDMADEESKYTLQRYSAQVQLYAWGLNNAGHNVEDCSIVFINRDGTDESDVFSWTFPYSEEYAVLIWERLENLWSTIQMGIDIETLDKSQHCFRCKINI